MLLTLWWALLYLLLVGMAAGWVAWLALGKKKMALKDGKRRPNGALLLGIGVAGSFVGGLAISRLTGDGLSLRPSGMVASALGAVVVAACYVWMQGRRA